MQGRGVGVPMHEKLGSGRKKKKHKLTGPWAGWSPAGFTAAKFSVHASSLTPPDHPLIHALTHTHQSPLDLESK